MLLLLRSSVPQPVPSGLRTALPTFALGPRIITAAPGQARTYAVYGTRQVTATYGTRIVTFAVER